MKEEKNLVINPPQKATIVMLEALKQGLENTLHNSTQNVTCLGPNIQYAFENLRMGLTNEILGVQGALNLQVAQLEKDKLSGKGPLVTLSKRLGLVDDRIDFSCYPPTNKEVNYKSLSSYISETMKPKYHNSGFGGLFQLDQVPVRDVSHEIKESLCDFNKSDEGLFATRLYNFFSEYEDGFYYVAHDSYILKLSDDNSPGGTSIYLHVFATDRDFNLGTHGDLTLLMTYLNGEKELLLHDDYNVIPYLNKQYLDVLETMGYSPKPKIERELFIEKFLELQILIDQRICFVKAEEKLNAGTAQVIYKSMDITPDGKNPGIIEATLDSITFQDRFGREQWDDISSDYQDQIMLRLNEAIERWKALDEDNEDIGVNTGGFRELYCVDPKYYW